MLHSLSLRSRLSLLLGAVLAAALTAGFALLILHAGARVRTEAEAATRLARELVEATLPQLERAFDPKADLDRLLADARRLRHVRVTLEGAEPVDAPESRAPAWFAALVMHAPPAARLQTPLATIVIAPNPADEIAEVWQEVVWLAIGAVAIAAAAFALVSYAVSRALRPVSALSDGLQRLERGDHTVRVAGDGPPEFVAIAERVNTLAATLQRLDDENRRLVRRMIHVQDEERRDIARDLHDEIGPFLFTVRAGVGALARKAAAPGAEPARLAEECGRIDSQIAALQQVNRRILGRLRPAALEEMGLADALQALARGWRESHPEVAIELSLDGAQGEIDETIALTAYRVAQEGFANAFRHSGATRVSLRTTRGEHGLRIEIGDNGVGLPPTAKGNGLGLRGMSERVSALGGALAIANNSQGGAILTATLPIPGRIDEE